MILAGDVGGTKVALALFDPDDGDLGLVREARYPTAGFEGLAEVARAFLDEGDERPERACFGVAGPVVGDTVELTNAGWTIDRGRLPAEIGVDRVDVLNDLEAAAYGLEGLPADRVVTLAGGKPRGSTAVLVAAGTGLGAAIVTEVEGRPRAIAGEGGHVDFAPRNDEEAALWGFLRERHGRVSAERVVSGPGIRAIYAFLRETGREDEPGWLADRLADADDPSAEISAVAMDGGAPICERTMEIFVECYGAAAGNLALSALALRGLWVGGGIAPSILPLLEAEERFVRAFRAKGRLEPLLRDVPVRVVREPRAAVLGAARYAAITGG